MATCKSGQPSAKKFALQFVNNTVQFPIGKRACKNEFATEVSDFKNARISVEGHFGTTNYFDDLIELKWTSGLRVYTSRIGQMVIVVLGG